MKKFCTVLGFILVLATTVGAQTVAFSTGEWAPFSGEALPNKGIATEIVVAVCKVAGIQYKFDFFPWARAESMVLAGQSFAAFPYSSNEERRAKYDYSEPLFYTVTKFGYYSKNKDLSKLKITGWADVKPYKIAYLAGSWLEKDMKTAGIDVTIVTDMEMAIKMLQAGRVDLVCDDSAVLTAAMQKAFPAEAANLKMLESTPLFGTSGPVHLLVSRTYPDSKALLAKFNAGIAAIKANGTLDAIAKKYGIALK